MHSAQITPATSPATVPVCVSAPAVRSQVRGIDSRFRDFVKIGLGGTGEVLECFDQERGHTVALKRLRPDRSNRQDDWTRFLREANSLRPVDNPALPQIYDVFPERMFKPYFTMELIEGIDLCNVLQGLSGGVESMEQSFPLRRLVEIVCQTARGLSVTHDAGLVHRDIKPENLMIANSGQLKIIDWGAVFCPQDPTFDCQRETLSSPTDQRRSGRLTRPGQRPGTPLYMSPEQVRESEAVDHRTDIFSLGAVLYDCLALTTLVRGRSAQEVFDFTRRGSFQLPSVAGLRPSVPPGLEQICMKAVTPEREQRYGTIYEFQRDLEAELRTKDSDDGLVRWASEPVA